MGVSLAGVSPQHYMRPQGLQRKGPYYRPPWGGNALGPDIGFHIHHPAYWGKMTKRQTKGVFQKHKTPNPKLNFCLPSPPWLLTKVFPSYSPVKLNLVFHLPFFKCHPSEQYLYFWTGKVFNEFVSVFFLITVLGLVPKELHRDPGSWFSGRTGTAVEIPK